MDRLAFISYRRDDADAAATRLQEDLARAFGEQQIFIDTSDIKMGEKWPERLEQALDKASVVLVVIGENWLRIADENWQRRLDKEDDWVRREIELALKSKIVIPVLIGRAKLPTRDTLHPSIARLVDQQAVGLRVAHWKADIEPLIARLESLGFVRSSSHDAQETLIVAALHQLPPPPRDFTGRKDELDELLENIKQGGVSISSLQGMGGVGKTTLALKLAAHLSASYPDAQFFLDLKGVSAQPLTAAEVQAHIIRAYHPTARLPESETELSGLYRSVLHGKRALLLLDNAKSAEQIEPLIPPDTCALLVTSRYHFTLPGLYAKRLDLLPVKDAEELLLRIAPRIKDQAAAMAKLCDYLPLALRLAATALAERIDIKVSDYLHRLEDAQQRLSMIDASVSLSYGLLSEQTQKQWRALAVFPGAFDSQAAAAIWELAPEAGQDVLSSLVAFSLVEWNEATGRYSLHDLVRLYAQSRMSEAERIEGQRLHAQHYRNVLGKAKALYLEGGKSIKAGLTLFDLEWGNIETGQSWAEQRMKQDEQAASLCTKYLDAGVYVLALRQHPRERINWLESALIAARKIKDRAAEGRHLGNMGLAYAALGETRKAIEYHEQALIIDREIGDRRGEGADLGNLGLAYADLGETRKAIEYYEQRLSIAREIGDRRGEGNALGNLGLAYAALGETRKAIEYYEQALIIDREIGDRRGEGNALGNLGNAYADLGEMRKAIEYYEQQLTIVREIGDRRGEANSLYNTSLALYELNDRSQAIALAETALQIYEQIESPAAEKVRQQLARWREGGQS